MSPHPRFNFDRIHPACRRCLTAQKTYMGAVIAAALRRMDAVAAASFAEEVELLSDDDPAAPAAPEAEPPAAV